MRYRVTNNNPVLIIGSSAEGKLSNDRVLPKKNIFPKQQKEVYSIENKEKYKAFSKEIAYRVNNCKLLKQKDIEIELLKRKNSARIIAEKLNRILINTTLP